MLLAQNKENSFSQLGTMLPTPNVYRTASGAPGHAYWQQQADYKLNVRIDEDKQVLYGEGSITYFNHSPDVLDYLWLQLDQNVRAKNSDTYKVKTSSISDKMEVGSLMKLEPTFEGGFNIDYLKGDGNNPLTFTINKTMLRVDPEKSLAPGDSIVIQMKWWYNINDRMAIGGRSGYEYFEEENNHIFTIAQFFPRMCVYGDNVGWQNKQFLGSGEFALPFGNYDVKITVPSDHVVGGTGVIVNKDEVLSKASIERLKQAEKSLTQPVFIVTASEAKKAEKGRAKDTKIWHFVAENVRDFGFASSRKFMWDAMGVKLGDRNVMAMSLFPKEGNPLWEQYSTKAVAQTLNSYSAHTVEYPYPVAYSVNSKEIGMEYPMICFNYGRPEKDGTYTERLKYGVISVIIHEVGHNFFPMIINSDERQWTWMDEGLNSFCQFMAEQEMQRDYPSRRGSARKIVDYMKGDPSKIAPIMTNSESIFQFGNNAYGKPATALNILRETVMGRELFDFAFKTYCERWAFKHPSPADFFRTMEDASAVDLDWFWRGWFYGTQPVDIAITNVKGFAINNQNPNLVKNFEKKAFNSEPLEIFYLNNKKDYPTVYIEKDPSLEDFYTKRNAFKVVKADVEDHQNLLKKLDADEKAFLNAGKYAYELEFENVGGLPMPIIVEFEFEDGSKERQQIPAEIWRFDAKTIQKVFIVNKPLKAVHIDPNLETADINTRNNSWPRQIDNGSFKLEKSEPKNRYAPTDGENEMQRWKRSGEKI